MSLLFNKPPAHKRPEGRLSIMQNGFALWEVWYDEGPGTLAQPVLNWNEPMRFLTDADAAVYIDKHLAVQYPDRRFKPVTR